MKESDLKSVYVYNKDNIPSHLKYRKPENVLLKKSPIIIFGCSFAYGHGLKEYETISYNMAKLTGRPIYNRALSGCGPQHALFQLRNKEFYKQVPKPEYVFYIYMSDHINRIQTVISTMPDDIMYKNEKRHLVLKKVPLLSIRLFQEVLMLI